MRKLLEIEKLSKSIKYENEITRLIKDLSFDIYYGEAIAMICPSEARLTPLLYIISGMNHDYEGTVQYEPDIEKEKYYRILYTCSKDSLYEWRTVLDNTLLFLNVNLKSELSEDKLKRYVLEAFEKYNLTKYKDKYPSQLSGSIKNKISLIKNLLLKPDLLILDNNFSNIDYRTKIELLDLLRNSFLNESCSILYATQNMDDILLLADRVLFLTQPPLALKTSVDITGIGKTRTPENVRENPKCAEFSNLFINELSCE